ncbi:MAG: hypothetical protein AAF828_03490 [Bacteroidota bacterium]
MKKNLEDFTDEDLKRKAKSHQFMMGLLLALAVALFYFGIMEYVKSDKTDLPNVIIAICTLGGFFSVYPEWRAIKKELKKREA